MRSAGILIFLKILLSFLPPSRGLHPPQCEWSLLHSSSRLTCRVDPGHNLIVEEEVFGIGPETAKSLWVSCTGEGHDPLSSAGFVLSHGVFMAVPNLEDLRLDSCRIAGITPGALSYLPNLQNLTIRTGTSLSGSWPSASASLALEVKSGVFRGLPSLRYLDLSTTALASLPGDFLCFLPALTHLNLTSAWLRDFRSIGIQSQDPTAESCGSSIRILDLSGNHFTLLPPATFLAVGNLEELRLDLNSITLAAERALLGLHSLRVISLSGNQLTSLPPEFFKDNRLLREIYLQNNSLGVLAPGLFTGLEHLISLDLGYNDLTSDWVNGETFKSLIRLVVLNLSHNRLSRIDGVLFRDLYSLQVLNLENNKISHISEDALAGTYNLHTLLLSHNNLKSIDERICKGLAILSFLALDNCKIEAVAPDSFQNCSSLQDLNLSSNKLTEVPFAIGTLSYLRTLDLGENQITDISNASYQRLPNLYGLRLTDNAIRTVAKGSFLGLPSLKIVNLAKNNITSLEPGTFDENPNLQAIRVDSNRLSNISGLFNHVPNLLWLNISANILEILDYSSLPPRLQWLDLRSNLIRVLGPCSSSPVPLRINKLDLSENLISEITASNLPDSIEKLSLRSNRISVIHPYTFFRKPNLTRVDLSTNALTRLDQNALRLAPGRLIPVELLLAHNPLQCDCSMEWLQGIEENDDDSGHYPVILDGSEVKCSLALQRWPNPLPYMAVQSSQFLCKYEDHCFSRCHCCDFDACDCQMRCPTNCSCFHDQGWGVNVVDCSGLENTQIPVRIPMDVTDLFLDGNVLPSLDSHAFLGRKNLRTLYLNGSHVESIQNRTFSGLKQLVVLHLENNFLERLEGFEFEELEDSLEELYLQQNSLNWISNETFSKLTRLRILWLHGNNFVDLAIWAVIPNPSSGGRLRLNEVTLRGNEWSCECQFTLNFREWLVENRIRVVDASQVQCIDSVAGGGNRSSSNGFELMVVRILEQKNHRCSQSTDLSVIESAAPDPGVDWSSHLPLLIVLSVLILVLIILFCISFYWRQTLRVWFHAKCGIRLTGCGEGASDRDKLFDAFVSYSCKDEAWVRQVLAAELEQHDPPYRLCLRYRDLPTGGTYLADTIVQASEASRRTVLVLSHHFLKGEWSRTDVKSAHHSVLKDRHRKVIIILLGDLPSKDLDPDVRLYLKTHTYLSSEDKRFWDKFHYALPDVKVKVPLSRGIHNRTSSHSHAHMNPPPQPPLPHYQSQPPHRPQPPPPIPPIPPSTQRPPHPNNGGGSSNSNSGMNMIVTSSGGNNGSSGCVSGVKSNRHVAIHI